MPAMPKPQPCGQNWLAMSPTENGRRCEQCDKVIHDFSKMSWPEIEQRQRTHGNALCGMYSPAQLNYWGQEPPAPAQGACARLAAATALALGLSAIPAPAQTAATAGRDPITIRGTVYESSEKGKRQPLPGVTVLLKGTLLGVSSGPAGEYELSIPNSAVARVPGSIVVSSVGYLSTEFSLDSIPANGSKLLVHDIRLAVDPRPPEAFYVSRPTLARRMWWTVKNWFRRNRDK